MPNHITIVATIEDAAPDNEALRVVLKDFNLRLGVLESVPVYDAYVVPAVPALPADLAEIVRRTREAVAKYPAMCLAKEALALCDAVETKAAPELPADLAGYVAHVRSNCKLASDDGEQVAAFGIGAALALCDTVETDAALIEELKQQVGLVTEQRDALKIVRGHHEKAHRVLVELGVTDYESVAAGICVLNDRAIVQEKALRESIEDERRKNHRGAEDMLRVQRALKAAREAPVEVSVLREQLRRAADRINRDGICNPLETLEWTLRRLRELGAEHEEPAAPQSSGFLPCPFCGHATTVDIATPGQLGMSKVTAADNFAAVCMVGKGGCGCSAGFKRTRDEAGAEWNRRAVVSAYAPGELATIAERVIAFDERPGMPRVSWYDTVKLARGFRLLTERAVNAEGQLTAVRNMAAAQVVESAKEMQALLERFNAKDADLTQAQSAVTGLRSTLQGVLDELNDLTSEEVERARVLIWNAQQMTAPETTPAAPCAESGELLPCPCCSGEAELHIVGNREVIRCENCDLNTGFPRTRGVAVSAWNDRASQHQPAQALTMPTLREVPPLKLNDWVWAEYRPAGSEEGNDVPELSIAAHAPGALEAVALRDWLNDTLTPVVAQAEEAQT